ncbi:four helix bundle protein, partial [Patescibacteria group bacterium]
MTNNKTNKIGFDLEDRTSKYGEDVIRFLKKLKRDIYNESLIKQLIRSATSIGANYREANSASSKKDFRNKIFICQKEAKETKHWLQMIVQTNPEAKSEAR